MIYASKLLATGKILAKPVHKAADLTRVNPQSSDEYFPALTTFGAFSLNAGQIAFSARAAKEQGIQPTTLRGGITVLRIPGTHIDREFPREMAHQDDDSALNHPISVVEVKRHVTPVIFTQSAGPQNPLKTSASISRDRDRTGTPLNGTRDFKSRASAYSATRPVCELKSVSRNFSRVLVV